VKKTESSRSNELSEGGGSRAPGQFGFPKSMHKLEVKLNSPGQTRVVMNARRDRLTPPRNTPYFLS
jgi:hypothetical protein